MKLMKTLTTVLLAVSIAASGVQAIDDATMATPEWQVKFFTTLSAIGALNHCERKLGYTIPAKLDEVVYLRLSEMMNTGLSPNNMESRQAMAAFADQVLNYADMRGVWIVGTLIADKDGKPAIKGTPVELDPTVCAAVETHLRQETSPGGLVPKPSRNEPQT